MFTVDRGEKHKVVAVDLKRQQVLHAMTCCMERMGYGRRMLIRGADGTVRHWFQADVTAIQALYRANGFDQAKVTTDVKDVKEQPNGKPVKSGEISVTYKIEEGPQQKFGTVALNGVDGSRTKDVRGR